MSDLCAIDRALDAVAASRSHRTITAECVAAVDLAIRTHHEPKPGPGHDWAAWSDRYGPEVACGYGATEAEAIQDLRDALEVADVVI